jgi:hypothetical protein
MTYSPGYVHTGERGRTEPKPDAAWSPEQTVSYMLDRLADGDFYIICPDNDVPSVSLQTYSLYALRNHNSQFSSEYRIWINSGSLGLWEISSRTDLRSLDGITSTRVSLMNMSKMGSGRGGLRGV